MVRMRRLGWIWVLRNVTPVRGVPYNNMGGDFNKRYLGYSGDSGCNACTFSLITLLAQTWLDLPDLPRFGSLRIHTSHCATL